MLLLLSRYVFINCTTICLFA